MRVHEHMDLRDLNNLEFLKKRSGENGAEGR